MSALTLQKTMRPAGSATKAHRLNILVMGLTGAGKSTFISVVTDNPKILICGAGDLDGEVQDYLLLYRYKGVQYEIHLIDSPGFDDGTITDTNNLEKIANYINVNYKLNKRLAGVLYLYDITRARVGGVGKSKLRMLEGVIGTKGFRNCTFVTTKWGCSDRAKEEARENSLREVDQFFGNMLQDGQARMMRFDPKSKETALDIMKPLLDNNFTAQITRQMADPEGPKLPLGQTDAGKVVANNVEKLAKAEQELQKVQQARNVLAKGFDEAVFEEFKMKRKKLKRQIRLQRSGRWIIRTTIVGGAIVATVLTLGPGASAFALEPVFEKVIAGQRKSEKKAKQRMQEEFRHKAANANKLKGVDPSWMWDSSVQNLGDLDSYSVRYESDEDIRKVLAQETVVGVAMAEAGEDVAGATELESSYGISDSEDSESSEIDFGGD